MPKRKKTVLNNDIFQACGGYDQEVVALHKFMFYPELMTPKEYKAQELIVMEKLKTLYLEVEDNG